MRKMNKQFGVIIVVLLSFTLTSGFEKLNAITLIHNNERSFKQVNRDTVVPYVYLTGKEMSRSNVFIDKNVKEPLTILRSIKERKKSYHLFSHGRTGELFINNKWMDEQGIVDWIRSNVDLNGISNLFIYGCEFAKGEKGEEAVKYIIEQLEINVAASNNITGSKGDWKLEVGTIKHELNIKDYRYSLQNLISPNGWSYHNGAEFVRWSTHRAINLNNGYVNHGYVEQRVNTIVGNRYVLTFKAHNHMTNGYRNPHTLTLNLRIGNVHNENIVLPSTPWYHGYGVYTRYFVANSTSTVIRLQHQSGDTYEHDILICNDVNIPYVRAQNCSPVNACNVEGNSEVSIGESSAYTVSGGTPSNYTAWSIRPTLGVSSVNGIGETTGSVSFSEEGTYTITFTRTNSSVPYGCVQSKSTVCRKVVKVIGCRNAIGLDSDRDGIDNACDLDSDNDGILDVDEGKTDVVQRDSDKDGVPDYLDLDSDNDGIYDIVEAGTSSLDKDKDGKVDNISSTEGDIDKDGLADIIEEVNGANKGTAPRETSGGKPDYLNFDSDADGCSDANEAYNNGNIDGKGDTYYNPGDLVEPLTLVAGAVDVHGKVTLALYTTGDVQEVIDKNGENSVCSNKTFAVNDFVNINMNETATGNVLINDYDLQGDTQTVKTTPVIDVSSGVLNLNSDGSFTYVPRTDFYGDDSFVYEVCDDRLPKACARATVSIKVLKNRNPKNMSPVANIDTGTTNMNISLTGNVLSNDYDPDNDPLMVNTTPIVNTTNGMLTLSANGVYTYVPNIGFIGVDSFTYQVCDNGTPNPLCDTAIVLIEVRDNKKNITVANDDAYTTIADTANNDIKENVLQNDSDPEGDVQEVNVIPVINVRNGVLSLSSDGNFIYKPNVGFVGQDKFVYQVCDKGSPQACDQATVNILVRKFMPPDYTITIISNRTNIVGKEGQIDFIVFIGEVNGFDSNGIDTVEFRMPNSYNLAFTYENTLSNLIGQQVFNTDWEHKMEGGLHKFIYKSNTEGVFKGNSFSRVGIRAKFIAPLNSRGKFPLKATIKFNSGGQVNFTNDNDEDAIQYNNTRFQ